MHRNERPVGPPVPGRSRRRAAALLAAAFLTATIALAGAPAGAIPAPGTISGTVTNSAGVPFDSDHRPQVALFDADNPGSGTQIDLKTVDGAGAYTFTDVAPGTYYVGASGTAPTMEPTIAYRENFDETVTWYHAKPIVVTSLAAITGIDLQLDLVNGCPPVFGAPGPFPDVPTTNLFCIAIDWTAKAGISTGSNGMFQPTAPVSRQAMAGFLYRYLGDPGFTPPPVPSFPDVPTSNPFYKAIEWLKTSGITSGTSNGTFQPLETINRGPMASFLYKAAGEPSFTPLATPFTDVPSGHPFRTAIDWLAASSITSGTGDGTFAPSKSTARQAMALYLHQWDVNSFLQGYGN